MQHLGTPKISKQIRAKEKTTNNVKAKWLQDNETTFLRHISEVFK